MEALLERLKDHHIDIKIVEGKLTLSIPAGLDANGILEAVNTHKQELVDYITARLGPDEGIQSVGKAGVQAYYPLSSTQKRLYFLYTLQPDSTAYNLPLMVRVTGLLDRERFRDVFQRVIARHESFRTSFELIDGIPVQRIAEEAGFGVEYLHLNESEAAEFLENYIRPFDLSRAPLVRATLISLSPEEHILAADMHHIITDGVSHQLMIKDLLNFYHGMEA